MQSLLLGEMLGIALMFERLFPDRLGDGDQLEVVAGSLLVVAAEELDCRFEVHLPGVEAHAIDVGPAFRASEGGH